MAEEYYEIKNVGIVYKCDACGLGNLQATGQMTTVLPQRAEHICNNCGEKTNLDRVYPQVTQVPVAKLTEEQVKQLTGVTPSPPKKEVVVEEKKSTIIT